MIELLQPYLALLYGASYNLLQTLDALGIVSTSFLEYSSDGRITGSYWSPAEANLVIFTLLLFYFFLLVVALILSGYALGRAKGVWITVAVIALPGLMNVWGLWPDIVYTPESYNLGVGSLGEINGYLALVLLACLSGWTTFVIISDTFNLGEKYRGLFDHAWYAVALIAGVMFIYDTGTRANDAQLNQERENSKELSRFFITQLKLFDEYCESNNLEHLESCKWSARTQNKLYDYIGLAVPGLFVSLGPKESDELYGIENASNATQIKQKIRNEVQQYNNLICPYVENGTTTTSAPISSKCIMTPASYCNAYPESSDLPIKSVLLRPVALASECLIPTLIMSRNKQESLSNRQAAVSTSKHYRWMYFVFFAVFVGAKIANTTTKVVAMDNRSKQERHRVLKLITSGPRLILKRTR
ncbi:hypothetical protein ACJO2A_23185 [Vibrio parahaemolyticus]|uniref:hypothetical protein n=1 Tax=Vibrio parahaemolyticus TaxID=670 RepID=UPI0007A0DEE7|nr:hypothetical protein [Vibrio parahaemolyticus]EGR3250568.1 hypothetical protein [Vibrio parahaemolyticus]EHK2865044.1 hypothetical protein [Vibrio parahaemolyticus]EHK2874066.1 hypothetical protein [Vibrio parahaemolyticus]EHZ7350251.1 hypothetical protein [Vibrio parahaemolyticus]EIT7134921.1 hypothetical protein [Vibrio parahaemolyticus]